MSETLQQKIGVMARECGPPRFFKERVSRGGAEPRRYCVADASIEMNRRAKRANPFGHTIAKPLASCTSASPRLREKIRQVRIGETWVARIRGP